MGGVLVFVFGVVTGAFGVALMVLARVLLLVFWEPLSFRPLEGAYLDDPPVVAPSFANGLIRGGTPAALLFALIVWSRTTA